MYLISDGVSNGNIHIRSCKCFDTIEDIKNMLLGVNRRYDQFSFVFEIYELKNNEKPVKIEDKEIWNEIKECTYFNRNKNGENI